MRRDVFQAIADPVRRDIIGLLAKSPQTVNTVAKAFPISRPAVSKHLKILQECGIVEYRKQGRERYCHLHPQSLQPVAEWMAHHRQLWEAKLDAFEQYLEDLQSPNQP